MANNNSDSIHEMKIGDILIKHENFEEITSTQLYALSKDLVSESIPNEWRAVSATIQTNGIATEDKKWKSNASGNVYVSIVLPYDSCLFGENPGLIMNDFARKAVVKVLNPILSQEGIEQAYIERQNDVMVNGKKICGVMTSIRDLEGSSFKQVIVGIGVNINMDEDYLSDVSQPATSLFIVTKKHFDHFPILKQVIEGFTINYLEGAKQK
ncbi:biotin-[acetyl-CoA-carboxylase] ligase [Tritrichomonas foetus]|uniref:Biotin-[acetyl-CoA-carboxylase] ligase n=1 Tax=Tritrichomonas foetus TaxID=1144522 RepID=A0A1J4JC50_9EUKA|nr:biotin-[acetyl-CoA-carboxylase] ligase [Tritrichomonas foetus]|eukprot:OHS94989.1 biotin-[acetyl-CoA-carboxylase] ligase [Tritrichomonas foetus]